MRRYFAILAALAAVPLVSSLQPTPALAQQRPSSLDSAKPWIDRAGAVESDGNTTLALRYLSVGETIVAARYGRSELALSSFAIGRAGLLGKTGDLAGRRRELERALGIMQANIADTDRLAIEFVVPLLKQLSEAALPLRDASGARGYLDRAVAIYAAQGKQPEIDQAALHLFTLSAILMRAEGKTSEALGRIDRVLAASKGTDEELSPLLREKAEALLDLSRIGEGREYARRLFDVLVVQIEVTDPSAVDKWTIDTAKNIAILLRRAGEPRLALRLWRGLDRVVAARTPDDREERGKILGNLATALETDGDFEQAEKYYLEALATLGASTSRASYLSNLGDMYRQMGRLNDARAILGQALELKLARYPKDRFPDGSHDLAQTMGNMAIVLHELGDLDGAFDLARTGHEMTRKAYPDGHFDHGKALTTLSMIRLNQGRLDEAEQFAREALAEERRLLPDTHPDAARAKHNLAAVLERRGRTQEALALELEADQVWTTVLPLEHPDRAIGKADVALRYLIVGRTDDGLRAAEASLDAVIAASRRAPEGARLDSSKTLMPRAVADLYYAIAPTAPEAMDKAFVAGQWAAFSGTSISVQQMAARGAAGSPEAAALVRSRQDTLRERAEITAEITRRLVENAGNHDAIAPLRQKAAELEAVIERTDGRLRDIVPGLAELSLPEPAAIATVQATLSLGELMLVLLDSRGLPGPTGLGPGGTLVWAITRDTARWTRIPLGPSDLTREVAALRCGLDRSAWEADSGARCAELLGVAYDATAMLPFPVARAHDLYRQLLAPIADLMASNVSLLVVASGALTALPLHVLVTEPAVDPADLRRVAWLARTHAVTVLPSVSSLVAMRRHARPSTADLPYLGLGNPVLAGNSHCPPVDVPDRCPEASAPATAASVLAAHRPTVASLSLPTLFRSGKTDVAKVREQCPLPDTALELVCVSRSLGASPDSLVLGTAMTEPAVRKLPLDRYRVIHFATHGLLAGEMSALSAARAEPALVMTPPAQATADDDGLLTTTEIAALKLDADWVVMSACNTAGGGEPGAEALSGLARAFFFAGARTLLVSHWPVYSYAATVLTSRVFAEARAHPRLGRAEALRRSMLAMVADTRHAWTAHPSVWAPFIAVGEGGASNP